jgi:F-type H+-transporting ATPase subunit b
MDSIISTFHIDWKIIIAQAINFGVVFVVLYIFALKPLSKLMNERGERIAKGLIDAKENAETLEKSRRDHEEVLSKARSEANKIFDSGKKEAEEKKRQMMEEAQREVATLVANGKMAIEAEKEKMLEEAKHEIVTLAVQVSEKILGHSVDKSFSEKTISELKHL